MSLSVDEHRIVVALRRMAESYERRASERVFGFDRVRADLLRSVAAKIERGEHR